MLMAREDVSMNNVYNIHLSSNCLYARGNDLLRSASVVITRIQEVMLDVKELFGVTIGFSATPVVEMESLR